MHKEVDDALGSGGGERQRGFLAGARKARLRTEIAPLPSMAGARLRQLTLSKIVPYDFVEPALRGLSIPLRASSLRSNGAPRGI